MEEERSPAPESAEKDEKSISSDLIRGHINTIILRSLYDGDKYGYEIIAEIERKSHGQYSLKQPSLYSALKRLEKDGYVTSYWGGSVAGGRRKYFSLTDEGKTISEQNQSEWEYSRTVIDSLISDKDFDFNNPAPTAVNMRVLRSSTSRVPSREEEDGELDYEPVYDDSLDVARLNEEFARKNTELTEEFEKKNAELTEEFEKKNDELAEEKSRFETEKLNFEEEMKARDEAFLNEHNRRAQELTERERAIEEEQQRLEALKSEHDLEADAKKSEREAACAAEEAQLEERKRLFEEEVSARMTAIDEEAADRKRLFDEEVDLRRSALEAEERERRRILDEEENARKATLDAEEQRRKSLLDAEEARRLRAIEDREAAQKLNDSVTEERLRVREESIRAQESFYKEEHSRFGELLRQKDEQIEAERRAHAIDLAEQEQRIVREQQAIFQQREKEIIHQNFLNLVNTPPQPTPEPTDFTYKMAEEAPAPAPTPAPAPAAQENYQTVVRRIYSSVKTNERKTGSDARAIDGMDFYDLTTRAKREGIRIVTTGGKPLAQDKSEAENLVHKGKALFLSAIVVFFLCIAEGAVILGLRDTYRFPVYYPYFIWGAGLALLLITGLAYANHFGARAIRRSSPALINAGVIYALLVIATLIVALAVKIDFNDPSSLAAFIVAPVICFFSVVVFGVCYYLLVRPKKSK